MQRHLRLGVAVPYLEQFDVVARGELVAFEKFLDCFHVKFSILNRVAKLYAALSRSRMA
jgi:hypothetical protein